MTKEYICNLVCLLNGTQLVLIKEEIMKKTKTNEVIEGNEVKEETEEQDLEIVRKELIFRKRDKELPQRYLKGDELFDMQKFINKHIYLYRNFEPAFVVEPGEIYFAEFPVGFGSELHGRHPVVVLHKSGVKNPVMTVIPLTSKDANVVSDYDLGEIKGLSKNHEHSIAVINQTRSIDKSRLVKEQNIGILRARQNKNPSEPGTEVRIDSFKVSRLPKDKLDKLKRMVRRFMGYNKIRG